MGRKRADFESADIFWKNYKIILTLRGEKEYLLLEKANIPQSTVINARGRNAFLNVVHTHALAKALNVQMEDFFNPSANLGIEFHNQHGEPEAPNPFDIILIPVLSQKIAAGNGQEALPDTSIIGKLPFLKRMLRGLAPSKARAFEVRGDSMTGIQLFDGDIVVFVPGEIHGDGIYVIRIMNDLYVKRVEFDPIEQKVRIMSENPRYPDRIESADGQTVEVVGKVYGWVHAHPY
jgi:phage repressor protein C with HTH and peptisase S24 domain